MFSRARTGALGVAVVLLAVASGITASATTPPSEPTAASGAVDISGDLFGYGFGYETGDDIAQNRVNVFKEAYPDVDISFSESGSDAQGLLAALASDDPPDMVYLSRNEAGSYVARDALMPLDDCLAANGVDLSNYYDAGLAQGTVDGALYAMPEFFNTRVWILNNHVFEEAGIDPTTVDLSDWDGLVELNEQLTTSDGSDVTRIGLDPKLPEFVPLWAWANGAPMISEDGRTAQLDDAGVIEAVELAARFLEPYGGFTAYQDFKSTFDVFGAENPFVTDQIGGTLWEQWYLNVLAENSPDVDITVRAFETPAGEPITWSDGNAWAIPTNAPNPDAACAFIATMTATDTWVQAAQMRTDAAVEAGAAATGTFTGNREADEIIFSEVVQLDDYPAFADAVQVVLDTQDSAFGLPPSPAAAEFQTAWQTGVTAALGGEDPADAMATAQQEAQDAIDTAAG
jgi:multiple sugar transport system substrate-binding protein